VEGVSAFLLCVVFVVTFYPFWNILVISFNNAADTLRGGLYFWPRKFALDSYNVMFRESLFLHSFWVSLARTALGAPVGLLCTLLAAFALTHEGMPGRKALSLFYIFTMYFGGGLIPYYMILKWVRLTDTFWVYIVPNVLDVFNLVVMMAFIRGLPAELEESAAAEGAGWFTILWRIVFPLCGPILATIGLFIAVGHWNSWFDSYAFTYNEKLKTLQAYLVQILNQYKGGSMGRVSSMISDSMKREQVDSQSIRMAATMIATAPIILVYPFVQKYFVKGILVGAIKS
jgi:putative aldouronate transport system permease protein